MAVRRILAGRTLLDKLPFYLAIPAGAFLGLGIGYAAAMPDAGPRHLGAMVAAFVVVMLLGLFAPRPQRLGGSATSPAPGAHGDGDAGHSGHSGHSDRLDTGRDDSLCD